MGHTGVTRGRPEGQDGPATCRRAVPDADRGAQRRRGGGWIKCQLAVPHRLSPGPSQAPLANSMTLTPTERAAKQSQHEEAISPEAGTNNVKLTSYPVVLSKFSQNKRHRSGKLHVYSPLKIQLECHLLWSVLSASWKALPLTHFSCGKQSCVFVFLCTQVFSRLTICSIPPILTGGVWENSGAGLSNF